jgi:frataxin-like iron-binding protein CyaY
MPLTKTEMRKNSDKIVDSMERTINSMEKELKKDDDFRKDVVAFHFGRLQEQFVNLYEVLKELNENR